MATNYSKKKQNKQAGTDFDLDNPDSNKVANTKLIENPESWELQIEFWRSHLTFLFQITFQMMKIKLNYTIFNR